MSSKRPPSCVHNKYKYKCITCRPQLLCIHNKRKSICIICTPSLICNHGKRKKSCNICMPSLLCTHGKRKKSCKICQITRMYTNCGHNSNKFKCIICNTLICKHSKNKNDCTVCKQLIKPKIDKNLIIRIKIDTSSYVCQHKYQYENCIYCYLMHFK
jgi:hypothetical protein